MEVIVVSQLTEVFNFDHFYKFSCGRYAQVTFVEKTQLKVIIHKHCYLIHTWSDKASVINFTLPSFHGGQLKLQLQSL